MSSDARGELTESIGYKILKKSGWKEGTGLGPDGQGRVDPVEAWVNKGRRGVGCPDRKPKQKKPKSEGVVKKVALKKSKHRHKERMAPESEEDLQIRTFAEKQKRKEAREAAIQCSFFREFATADMATDSNPLLRRNNLTDSNPLLDS